jgi:hypothetical protein
MNDVDVVVPECCPVCHLPLDPGNDWREVRQSLAGFLQVGADRAFWSRRADALAAYRAVAAWAGIALTEREPNPPCGCAACAGAGALQGDS